MTDLLLSLFQAIAETENEPQLQQTVMSRIGLYFAAKRYRLFIWDRLPQIVNKFKLFQLNDGKIVLFDCNSSY